MSILVAILNTLLLVGSYLYIYSIRPENSMLFLIVPALTYFVVILTALRKGIYELGLDNVRGRFMVFFALGTLMVSLSFLAFSYRVNLITYILLYIGHLVVTLSVIYTFMSFVRMGYRPDPSDWFFGTAIFAILLVGGYSLILSNTQSVSPLSLVIVIIGYVLFFFTVMVAIIYWGSDLGRRWLLGVIAGFTFATADVFLVIFLNNPYEPFIHASSILFGISGVVMSIIFSLKG